MLCFLEIFTRQLKAAGPFTQENGRSAWNVQAVYGTRDASTSETCSLSPVAGRADDGGPHSSEEREPTSPRVLAFSACVRSYRQKEALRHPVSTAEGGGICGHFVGSISETSVIYVCHSLGSPIDCMPHTSINNIL